MKFTAIEEYGLRCMLQFARLTGVNPSKASVKAARSLTIGEIAKIEGLSPQYAGKLVRILRMGGLLESVRGRHGGYRLARPIEGITLAQVIAALGGRIFDPDYCSRYTGDLKLCVHSVDCTIRSLWGALQDSVDKILARISLRDLIGGEKQVADWIDKIARESIRPVTPGPCASELIGSEAIGSEGSATEVNADRSLTLEIHDLLPADRTPEQKAELMASQKTNVSRELSRKER